MSLGSVLRFAFNPPLKVNRRTDPENPNSPSGGSTYWEYNFVALESFSWTFFKEMSEVSAADEFMYGVYKDALMVVAEFLSAAVSGEGTVRVLLEETVNALIGIVVGIAIQGYFMHRFKQLA